jgi:signal transduction histidine kinase
VSEVVDSLKEEIAKKKIELLVKGEDTTTHIQADKHLCLIVIKNLLSNALFFSKDGGRVEVCVKHVQKNSDIGGIHAPKEGILVSVADNGIGIPETDQPKIYSKMFRASNVKDSEHNGSGLGLYITKGILEYVGGSLWHISTEGKGSTFYALFPIQGMKKKVGTTTLD